MFGFKKLNINKKESLVISLCECNIKYLPKTFIISVKSENRYGASEETIRYILQLFFRKYIIFAYSMFSKKVYKKGFKNYFFDEKEYNAIFGQDELHNIFLNPGIGERIYFIDVEYENIDKELYEKSKEYIYFIEGKTKEKSFIIKVMGNEGVWDDLYIMYTSIDDYIKDIKDLLPELFLYLRKNELLY